MAQDQLIDYDHLELEDPSAHGGLLSTDALKLGGGASLGDGGVGLGALSNSTTGFADD